MPPKVGRSRSTFGHIKSSPPRFGPHLSLVKLPRSWSNPFGVWSNTGQLRPNLVRNRVGRLRPRLGRKRHEFGRSHQIWSNASRCGRAQPRLGSTASSVGFDQIRVGFGRIRCVFHRMRPRVGSVRLVSSTVWLSLRWAVALRKDVRAASASQNDFIRERGWAKRVDKRLFRSAVKEETSASQVSRQMAP